MEIHDDLPPLFVDMDVRRSDMPATSGGIIEVETASLVRTPGALQPIGHRKTDITPVMMGKIEVELAQPIGQPCRRADQGRAVYVAAVL